VGFHEVERGALPLKAWKDCLRCPKFQSCDEIAVIKYLVPEELRHDPIDETPSTLDFVQLPILRH
jgi:amino-acid N-acetyltransferase